MPRIIALPPLSTETGEPVSWPVTILLEGRTAHADLVRLWQFDLAMAARDGAVSVHYHPWRTENQMSCVVSGTRFEMMPPPDESGDRYVAAAAALLYGRGVRGVWAAVRRWLRLPPRVSGRVRLVESDGTASDWVGVVWSAGGVAGVEWYRLTPVGQTPNAEPTSVHSGLTGTGRS